MSLRVGTLADNPVLNNGPYGIGRKEGKEEGEEEGKEEKGRKKETKKEKKGKEEERKEKGRKERKEERKKKKERKEERERKKRSICGQEQTGRQFFCFIGRCDAVSFPGRYESFVVFTCIQLTLLGAHQFASFGI